MSGCDTGTPIVEFLIKLPVQPLVEVLSLPNGLSAEEVEKLVTVPTEFGLAGMRDLQLKPKAGGKAPRAIHRIIGSAPQTRPRPRALPIAANRPI